jgi:hypothetical protein
MRDAEYGKYEATILVKLAYRIRFRIQSGFPPYH